MPQMSPTSWLFILSMIMIILMMISSWMFFSNNIQFKKNNKIMLKKNYMKW